MKFFHVIGKNSSTKKKGRGRKMRREEIDSLGHTHRIHKMWKKNPNCNFESVSEPISSIVLDISIGTKRSYRSKIKINQEHRVYATGTCSLSCWWVTALRNLFGFNRKSVNGLPLNLPSTVVIHVVSMGLFIFRVWVMATLLDEVMLEMPAWPILQSALSPQSCFLYGYYRRQLLAGTYFGSLPFIDNKMKV